MFPDYQGVVVKEELTSFGYSGGRVYRVHLLKEGDAPELPLVVKIGSSSLIEREVRAYHECVRNQWPGIAELYGEPVYLREHDVGCLCYPLMGGGVFKMQSLREYCLEADVEDVRFVLEERLFRIMEQRILRPARNVFEYPLRASYDRVLPVNLLVEPKPLPVGLAEGKAPVLITPDRLPRTPLQCGTPVRLEGFIITEVDPHRQQITLNVPSGKPPQAYRLRLQPVENLETCAIDGIELLTGGIVRETRCGRLEYEVAKAMGETFDLAGETVTLPGGTGNPVVLPNPLLAVPDILSQSRHVRVNYIHGDLNLENVLVDPQVRDVRLIDFADARRDHVLLDLLRLETGVVTKLIPGALVEAQLPPESICPFYKQLHCATFQFDQGDAHRLLHPALEKYFAILSTIRKAVCEGLYDRDDFSEYYQGLILYLLGALKFENLDTMPRQESTSILPLRVPGERVEPSDVERRVLVVPVDEPTVSGRKPFLLRRKGTPLAMVVAILVIVVGVAMAALFWPHRGPLDISRLCAIEKQLAISVAMGEPSRYSDLLSYYRDANSELFGYVDSIARKYQEKQAHRGATYVIGGPGVGKSFVALSLDQFSDDDQCKIRMGEFAESGGQGIDFEMLDDLVTLDNELTFNQLPTFAHPEAFTLDSLFAAGGCVRDSRVVPLVIIDDLNELHDESIWLILGAVEEFIPREPQEGEFVHILVFGRPEAFASWFRQVRRSPPDTLLVSRPLEGAVCVTSGDLEFTYRDYLDYRKLPAPSQDDVDAFVKLIVDHPFLTYSIRILSMRNFVIEASLSNIKSEAVLKHTAYDSLLERDRQVHGRGESYMRSYEYLFQDIAARYLDKVDENGFFVVEAEDKIQVYDDQHKQVIGQVYVRDALDRSGIASLEFAHAMLTRYRFDPFWIHAHLVEQRNQRLYPGYEYRTCK
jgi:hypothetical protein